jgi:GntR family transcriptional regulator
MKLRELVRIDPDSPLPVYAQIEEQMVRLIAAGTFPAGEKLPSVRALGVALRVNPLTVSKAYARLADRGLVRTERGRGVFVNVGPSSSSKKERERSLAGTVDRLLTEAKQLGFNEKDLLALIRKRSDL